MAGIDPISLGLSGVQTLAGITQSIFGGIREHKALQGLENLKTPTYSPNKSILDYYNTSLQRYNVNPYQSQLYNYATQNAANNTAAGVNSLQDKRSAVAGIGRLTALQNNSNLQAGIQAEQQRNQNFSQLGNATQMKSADDQYGFQINQLMPYEKQSQLLGLKASGGANIMNAGLSNIFGGLGSASSIVGDSRINQSGGIGSFQPYSSDYSLAPIQTADTSYGAPPSILNRNSGSLRMGYGMTGPKNYNG